MGDRQAPTGCGATAMAQVMYYWKYPKTGKGRASYNSVFAGMELSLDFSSQVFDWDNMLDKYYPNAYTDEQANAVAELMRACGYSVKMHYAADQSEAEPEFFADAFINRFKYDGKTVKFVERRNRTQSELATTRDEWEKLIYGELAAGRPMVFAGYDEIRGLGGHIFVCDGYDGNGKFHFNFGWAGTSDGYFSMDAVTPRTMGGSVTGASTGQYSFRQTATVGVKPPAGTLTASALTLGGKKVDMTRDEFVFVKSLDDIEVKLTLEGKTGRVVSPISVKVYDMDTEEEICSQLVTDPVTISEGWTVSTTGSFTVPFGGGDRIPYLVKFYYTIDDKETNFLEVEMALDEDVVIPDNPGNEDPGGDTPDDPGNEDPGADTPDNPGNEDPGADTPDDPGNEDPGADTPDNPGAENGIFAVDASGNRLYNVYSPVGILIKKSATQEQLLSLPAGIYIINGRKYIIK